MAQKATELYHPRAVSDLGLWEVGHLQFKVYCIIAEGQELTETIIKDAREFTDRDVPPLVAAEG